MTDTTSDARRFRRRKHRACAGKLLTLDKLDGRSAAARRAMELISGIEVDLGGQDRMTVAERQLVQRSAVLGAFIENCEARWLAGESVDTFEWLAAVNAQQRVLAAIGLKRRPRDVEPTLEKYIEAQAEAEAESGEEG